MARFRGYLKSGDRPQVTRLGHKTRGLRVDADGWNSGVTVYASVDEHDRDVFDIYRTGGSNGGASHRVARIVGTGPGAVTLLPDAWGNEHPPHPVDCLGDDLNDV